MFGENKKYLSNQEQQEEEIQKKQLIQKNRSSIQNYINKNYKKTNLSNEYEQDLLLSRDSQGELALKDELVDQFGQKNDIFGDAGSQSFTERKVRIRDYYKMAKNAYLKRSLRIYASSQINKDLSGKILHINSGDVDIKIILTELFNNRLNIEEDLWSIAYRQNKFGELFIRVVPDSYVNPTRVESIHIIPDIENMEIILNEDEKVIGYLYQNSRFFYPFEMIHIFDDSGEFYPYGESTLEASREGWHHYKLLKNFMILQRLESGEKTAVYYPIGNKKKSEAEEYGNLIRNAFRKRTYINGEGDIDTSINPSSFFERYYIPVSGTGNSVRVEPIKGGTPISQQDDIQLALDEMIRGQAIPNAYMGIEAGGEMANATLAQLDVNFAKIVENKNAAIIKGLYKLAYIELIFQRKLQKDNYDIFTLDLTPPSDLKEKMELENLSAKFGAIGSIQGTGLLPNKYILKKYLNFSNKEMMEIEAYRKEEMAEQAAAEGGGAGGGTGEDFGIAGGGEDLGMGGDEMETGADVGGGGEPVEGEAGGGEPGIEPPVAEEIDVGESKKLLQKYKYSNKLFEEAKELRKKVLELERIENPLKNYSFENFFYKGEFTGVKLFLSGEIKKEGDIDG